MNVLGYNGAFDLSDSFALSCATLADQRPKPTAHALTALLAETWGELIGRDRR